ncbi:MAG TPA: acetyl-CoA carboxylase biotin carboxyl carrier protein [Polyangiaceae bacterium]
MEISLKQLKNLLKALEEEGVAEFEYKDEKYSLRVGFGRSALAASALPAHAFAAPVAAAAPEAPAAKADEAGIVFVTSPFVGTFYRSPSPDSEPFVEIGSVVKPGQSLCIVEAMKLMNEIESEHGGTVVEIMVENGTSVEFGQKLFKLKQG